ncbi:myosin-11-like [Anoplophora glabripennis]|uniref:myosin-11-like n=1 Tax=Anoplophora glabripennis TaxID=217634 RepID=UPI0008747059|nr:myosin-11-like [Anoplophora glabripennis]
MTLNENLLSTEEVERALTEIENKYSPIKSNGANYHEDNLTVLVKEFDSIGLPSVDLSQSLTKIFNEVVSNARSLVQIHRKTLAQMKNVNINSKYKESKSTELYKAIDDYKLKLTKHKDVNSSLQNKIIKLTNDHTEVIKREIALKEELEKTKRYYKSKQNELHHQIKKLIKENGHLKEMLGKDMNIPNSKDEVVLKLLRQYKDNEEIYKATIHKLQENNRELLSEIVNLKEENTVTLGDDNKQNCF